MYNYLYIELLIPIIGDTGNSRYSYYDNKIEELRQIAEILREHGKLWLSLGFSGILLLVA